MEKPVYKPGRPPKPVTLNDIKRNSCCLDCQHARQRFRESCYCIKYGITIGYGKVSCEGYKDEQIRG